MDVFYTGIKQNPSKKEILDLLTSGHEINVFVGTQSYRAGSPRAKDFKIATCVNLEDGDYCNTLVSEEENFDTIEECCDKFFELINSDIVKRILKKMAKSLGSKEAADLWMDTVSISSGTTPRKMIEDGQAYLVEAQIDNLYGPSIAYT